MIQYKYLSRAKSEALVNRRILGNKINRSNAAINVSNVLPQRGEGGHTRDIDIEASPVTGAAELLLTQGSLRVGAFLVFSAEKDWEKV